MGRFRSLLWSPVLLGVLLFVFSVIFPPFEDLTEVDLTVHMTQHVLIALAGATIAYHFYRNGSLRSVVNPTTARLGFVAVVGVLAFWHLPGPWDSAVLDPVVHVVEHFAFFAVGLIAGSFLLGLSDSGKIAALLVAFFGHMAYAIVLVSPTSAAVYPLYSIGQQSILGWVLILTGPSFLVGVGYLLVKNPTWLQGSGITIGPRASEVPRGRHQAWRGIVTVSLTLLMLATLLVYFGFTAVAIAGVPSSGGAGGSVVYIAETPVTWQYSPQAITVVLGVNNTVTWVSHSVSYDTVTSAAAGLVSGPIAPGQTFSFTFDKPGVYSYHCDYHPWMVGTVTVVAGP